MAFSGLQITRLGISGITRSTQTFTDKPLDTFIPKTGGMLSAKNVRRAMRRGR